MTLDYPPLIFNAFKPAGMSSYDVVRFFKRNLPGRYGKIGHFGTLDPFASGVLLIGVGGAMRLNDIVHESLPKTYIAVGKLGVETATGDLTVAPSQVDNTIYLNQKIAQFDVPFLQEQLGQKFVGPYMQAPHTYSAAKFQGKALHKWAREGVVIKKEPKLRHIHSIEVMKYKFPYLSLRVSVSSGTYIRTFFSDIANHLGTLGCLVSLVRESIGHASIYNALKGPKWPGKDQELSSVLQCGMNPEKLLSFPSVEFENSEQGLFYNGNSACFRGKNGQLESAVKFSWAVSRPEGKLMGLIEKNPGPRIKLVFPS